MKLQQLLKHLKTIHIHRKFVRQMCFKMGIPWQGFVHDISKYSLQELGISKYYAGTRSPHAVCREQKGFSPSWMHHYHCNRHHWEYWLDIVDWPNAVQAAKMPYKYVIEMFCDMVGAGKAYQGVKWTCKSPWEYYLKACEGKRLMHQSSEYLVKQLFIKMDALGEKGFYVWYKNISKKLKEDYKDDFKRIEN